MLQTYYNNKIIVAGCDEAGRGALAGPVVASAVILPFRFNHPLINDSKKTTKLKREKAKEIIKNQAIAFGIGIVDPEEIDKMNILNATFLAMHRAIKKLKIKPEELLIDGNRFKAYKNIKHTCIVKGDEKIVSIAAASILAKTKRDSIMKKLDQKFPEFDWKNNKGYPTVKHRKAIQENGNTIHHRTSFKLLKNQIKLKF